MGRRKGQKNSIICLLILAVLFTGNFYAYSVSGTIPNADACEQTGALTLPVVSGVEIAASEIKGENLKTVLSPSHAGKRQAPAAGYRSLFFLCILAVLPLFLSVHFNTASFYGTRFVRKSHIIILYMHDCDGRKRRVV